MGILLLEDWTPRIFVGVLLDREEIKPLKEAKGPDFTITLDFHPNYHKVYPSNEHYKLFISRISKQITKLGNGWEFYNHLGDDYAPTKNKHHPIYIRKSLLDVLKGTNALDEQAERFHSAAIEIITLIFQEDSFWALRDDLKNRSLMKQEL